jgi:hypothetical protein
VERRRGAGTRAAQPPGALLVRALPKPLAGASSPVVAIAAAHRELDADRTEGAPLAPAGA